MIFSLHDQVNGGFQYFEAPGVVPINDDHPTPSFVLETPLGVPSTLAGRPIPVGATPEGYGLEAKGIIVSKSAKAGLATSSIPSGLGAFSDELGEGLSARHIAIGAAIGLAIAYFWRK